METCIYIWDVATDSYLSEKNGGGATTAAYTNEPKQFGKLISQRRGSETRYYELDVHHSTRMLTDESGSVTDEYIYSAFGQTVLQAGSTVNMFDYNGSQGSYTDGELATIYIRARNYHVTTSRWLSIDPLGLLDGTNLYKYAHCNPVLFDDPSGLSLCYGKCPQANPQQPLWYGCFCGAGNPPSGNPIAPLPIDPVDNACVGHDTCYGQPEPPCAAVTRERIPEFPFFKLIYDARPHCIGCDREFCRALKLATCNRYGTGTPEYETCINYRNSAMILFGCASRFHIAIPKY